MEQLNFDIDEPTKRKLSDLAQKTGIKNNAGTIRYCIHRVWSQMQEEPTLPPETIDQEVERRR